jgi:hypothetical protein
VAGLVFVYGAHPDLFGERRGRRRTRIPGFVLRSQDVAAQFFNAVGLYRLGPVNDAPARPAPAGVTEQEWAAVWRLTKGSRAKSALMQDIAAWDKSTAEARQTGSLGDLPLAVVYSRDTPLGAELADMWLQQQTELAALSTGATSVAVDGADPIFEAPGVVLDAVKRVLARAARGPERAAKETVPSVPGFRR